MADDLDAFMKTIGGRTGAKSGTSETASGDPGENPRGTFMQGVGQAGLGLIEAPAQWVEHGIRHIPGLSGFKMPLHDWAAQYRRRAENSLPGLAGEAAGTLGLFLIPGLGELGAAAKAATLGTDAVRMTEAAGAAARATQAATAARAGAAGEAFTAAPRGAAVIRSAAEETGRLSDVPAQAGWLRGIEEDYDAARAASRARTTGERGSRAVRDELAPGGSRLFTREQPTTRAGRIADSHPFQRLSEWAAAHPRAAFALKSGAASTMFQPASDRDFNSEMAERFMLGMGLGALAARAQGLLPAIEQREARFERGPLFDPSDPTLGRAGKARWAKGPKTAAQRQREEEEMRAFLQEQQRSHHTAMRRTLAGMAMWAASKLAGHAVGLPHGMTSVLGHGTAEMGRRAVSGGAPAGAGWTSQIVDALGASPARVGAGTAEVNRDVRSMGDQD
jgi:hypothetical protein